MKSLYDILGIGREATAEEIKTAYRRRAFETHPDQGGDREEFQRVQHAWEVLGDAQRRRRYDQLGDDGRTDLESPEQLAADCFRAMLRQGWSSGTDLVRHAAVAMIAGIAEHLAEVRKWGADVERLERYARRLRRRAGAPESGDGRRVLEDAIEAELETPRAKVAFHRVAASRLQEALGILECYEFGEGDIAIEAKKKRRVKRENCPTCGARVHSIFDHVDGCPRRSQRSQAARRKAA